MKNKKRNNTWIFVRIIILIVLITYLFITRNNFASDMLYSNVYLILPATYMGMIGLFSMQYLLNKHYRRKWMWPSWKECPLNIKEPLQTFCFFGELIFSSGLILVISAKNISPFFIILLAFGFAFIAAAYSFGLLQYYIIPKFNKK